MAGVRNPEGLAAAETLASVRADRVLRKRVLAADPRSSELVADAFFAPRASSINSTGANVSEIARASPVGFGGSCFRKDTLDLVCLRETHGLKKSAGDWNRVIAANNYQKTRLLRRMVSGTFDAVAGKKIAVPGHAFEKDAADMRETPPMFVVRDPRPGAGRAGARTIPGSSGEDARSEDGPHRVARTGTIAPGAGGRRVAALARRGRARPGRADGAGRA